MLRIPAIIALSSVVACASSEPEIPFPQDGKADQSVQTLQKGMLEFGANNVKIATFPDSPQFHNYQLPSLTEGAVISVRTFKMRDNWEPIDTTLFLFKVDEEGQPAPDPVVFDDNGGDDDYAAIREFTVDEAGDYLLVAGQAADGPGGHYAVDLRCDSETCIGATDKTILEPLVLDLSSEMQALLEAANTSEDRWIDLASFEVVSDPDTVSVEAVQRGLADFYADEDVEWLPVPTDDFSSDIASFLLEQSGVLLSEVEDEFGLVDYEVGAIERFWECEGTAECNGFLIFFAPSDLAEVVVVDTGVVTL